MDPILSAIPSESVTVMSVASGHESGEAGHEVAGIKTPRGGGGVRHAWGVGAAEEIPRT